MQMERFFGVGTKRKSHGTTFAPGKFHGVPERFFDRNAMPCRLANQPSPLRAPSCGRFCTNREYLKPPIRDTKRGSRAMRESQHFESIDRIPDQEEAAVTVKADRSTKVGAEPTDSKARCCE
ncbi:hypothetical protein ACVWY3_004226 [Bradyrhizobium sp. USDA 4486]